MWPMGIKISLGTSESQGTTSHDARNVPTLRPANHSFPNELRRAGCGGPFCVYLHPKAAGPAVSLLFSYEPTTCCCPLPAPVPPSQAKPKQHVDSPEDQIQKSIVAEESRSSLAHRKVGKIKLGAVEIAQWIKALAKQAKQPPP